MSMILPHSYLGNIMQMAWVTTDLDRALAQFRDLYGIPEFRVMEVDFEAEVRGEKGRMHLRIALANVDNLQLELICPLGSSLEHIYREVVREDTHDPAVHHICVQVHGTLDDWNNYHAKLAQDRDIVYTGEGGPNVRFVYTDERSALGMYLEHVWFSADHAARLSATIPTYRTR